MILTLLVDEQKSFIFGTSYWM